MKKFNANGEYRKDATKEYNEHDLNNYSGKSFEEAKEELDDTVIFSEEDLEKVRTGIKGDEESADMNR